MTKFSLLALLLWPVTLPAVDLPPWAENLAADAQVSVQARKPVVVMFRSEECPYCEIVLKHYLGPLAEDPDYRNRVQIRVVDVDGHDLQLTGFDGHRQSHADFAQAQGVTFVPTVRFFGPNGSKLAPDLVGLGLEDFYLWYLWDGIDAARDQLAGPG